MAYSDNRLKSWLSQVLKSFKIALQGIGHTYKAERNFRIETAIAVLAILLGIFLHISSIEWTIILLCNALVLGFELINTAIEALVDLVTQHQYFDLAKIAKDTAAGAVFLAAMISFIIGVIIFLPHLWQLFLRMGS